MSANRVSFVISLILVASTFRWCGAQAQRNPRREFVQSLLQTFIDSQLPREPEVARPPDQPARTPADATRNALLLQAGQLLTQASAEMAQLVGALQADIYRAPGVRQLLSLAMDVNADAAVLSRRLANAPDIESLREPLRKLDQDWLTLEYRLRQLPNLSRNTVAHIERIGQYEARLTSMLDLPTQVDAASISQQAARMNESLRGLLEEIRYEIEDTAAANRLLQDGRDTYDQLQRLIRTTASNSSYEVIKREYELLESAWAGYEGRLRRVNNQFIQRYVQRINDAHRNIKGLLYISAREVDREDLIYATKVLQRDIDQLLSQVTLKMLSELPGARRFAVESAADFDGSCQDLLDVLESGDELDVVRDVYTFMFDEWERLSLALQGISSPETRQLLRDIERSLNGLQSQLGINFDFNRRQATELAAALASQARHVQSDMRDFFGRPNRYSREFQEASLQAAAEFRAACDQLHTEIEQGGKLRQLKTTCQQMSAAWEKVNQYVPRFASSEQAHLNKVRRQLTPQVVQMQTLLAL